MQQKRRPGGYTVEIWLTGYHYPTLADLLTQVTAVESSDTDLQVAMCELYEEKEENWWQKFMQPDPQGYQDAGRGARPSAQHRESPAGGGGSRCLKPGPARGTAPGS